MQHPPQPARAATRISTARSSPPDATRSVVALDGLTKRYGSAAAVDSLSFDVRRGDVTGLLGPNGAGKTTAMKMLAGLVRPTAGHVRLLGAELGSREFADAVRRVGTLIESPALYEGLTARENLELQALALELPRRPGRIDEILELVDLQERADDQARAYSLGMKQRLGIGVAMIGRPELVILDEPANGLDPAGIVQIRELLRRLPELGTTVLVSSHQLGEVQRACDRLVVLSSGRLIAQGSTHEIMAGYDNRDMTVRLEPFELDAAIDHLGRSMFAPVKHGADTLTVTLPQGRSGRDVNGVLCGAGIFARELVQQTADLETAFLDMTGEVR